MREGPNPNLVGHAIGWYDPPPDPPECGGCGEPLEVGPAAWSCATCNHVFGY